MKRTRDDGAPAAPIPIRAEFIKRPCSAAIKSGVQQVALELIFRGVSYKPDRYIGERPELPGPLPKSLTSRTLALVAGNAYGVCEKSDGERAMMLLVATPTASAHGGPLVPPGAYLIDRTFDAAAIDGGVAYAAVMAAGGATLLEGELLLRGDDAGTGTGARAVFNMFDCIAAAGADVAARPLKERLEALRKTAREPYLSLERARAAAGEAAPPLYMIGKTILRSCDVKSVLDKISAPVHAVEDDEMGDVPAPLESVVGGAAATRTYRGDALRINGTDGLVFTPSDVSYRDLAKLGSAAPLPLLKWKFTEENTVDFRVNLDDLDRAAMGRVAVGGGGAAARPVPLFVSTGREERDVCELEITPKGAAAYAALAQRLHKDSLIIECAFVPARSAWVARRVRDKKTRANHIKTAWNTLEALVENISEAELVRVLGKGGGAGIAAGGGGAGAKT